MFDLMCFCLLVIDGLSAPTRLPLKRVTVVSEVTSVFVTGKLTQTYHAETPGNAKVYFPKDPLFTIYSLKATTSDNKTVTAILKAKEEAQKDFDDAKKAGRTATLTTYDTSSSICFDLANVPAGDFIIEAELSGVLRTQGKEHVVRWPSYIAPIFADELLRSENQATNADTEIFISVTLPKGLSVRAEFTGSQYGTDSNGNTLITSSTRGALHQDFLVFFTYKPELEQVAVLNGAQGALVAFTPKFPTREYPIALSILLDISGSMDDQEKLIGAISAIMNIILGLKQGDYIQLITWSDTPRIVFDLKPFNDKTKQKLWALLPTIHTEGGTQPLEALKLGIKSLSTTKLPANVRQSVLFATDGDSGYDLDEIYATASSSHAPINVLIIGNGVSMAYAQTVARNSGGEEFLAKASTDMVSVSQAILSSCRQDTFKDLKVTVNGCNTYTLQELAESGETLAKAPVVKSLFDQTAAPPSATTSPSIDLYMHRPKNIRSGRLWTAAVPHTVDSFSISGTIDGSPVTMALPTVAHPNPRGVDSIAGALIMEDYQAYGDGRMDLLMLGTALRLGTLCKLTAFVTVHDNTVVPLVEMQRPRYIGMMHESSGVMLSAVSSMPMSKGLRPIPQSLPSRSHGGVQLQCLQNSGDECDETEDTMDCDLQYHIGQVLQRGEALGTLQDKTEVLKSGTAFSRPMPSVVGSLKAAGAAVVDSIRRVTRSSSKASPTSAPTTTPSSSTLKDIVYFILGQQSVDGFWNPSIIPSLPAELQRNIGAFATLTEAIVDYLENLPDEALCELCQNAIAKAKGWLKEVKGEMETN